ncbi:MAG: polyprenyl synthetase family protein [Planctomycetota bacterium]
MNSVGDLLRFYGRRSEEYLERWVTEDGCPQTLREAMHYCVFNGGKRLRPSLVMLAAEAAGAKELDELTARTAVAVELIHCYSLVHDDLPSMDDDDLRRGQPTAHIKFGEAMAILAGDALVTRAFGVLGDADSAGSLKTTRRVSRLVGELARAAGAAGMVAGQVADMNLCEVPDGPEGLDYIHSHKTAALIRAAVRMGAICADANNDVLAALSKYGEHLGLAFQLVDDLLDVTGEVGTLGKTPGKDKASGKRTHVSELGLNRARELTEHLTARAVEAIVPLGEGSRKLQTLVMLLAERSY